MPKRRRRPRPAPGRSSSSGAGNGSRSPARGARAAAGGACLTDACDCATPAMPLLCSVATPSRHGGRRLPAGAGHARARQVRAGGACVAHACVPALLHAKRRSIHATVPRPCSHLLSLRRLPCPARFVVVPCAARGASWAAPAPATPPALQQQPPQSRLSPSCTAASAAGTAAAWRCRVAAHRRPSQTQQRTTSASQSPSSRRTAPVSRPARATASALPRQLALQQQPPRQRSRRPSGCSMRAPRACSSRSL